MVLSQEKVAILLASCTSLKYRTLVTLAYASGLESSELRSLTARDLDSDRKQVYVRNGKNGRNRYSILGNKSIQLPKTYMDVYRPHSLLFFSRKDSTSSVSRYSIRREFRKLLAAHGLDVREVHLHTLRHCFAAHLVESGTSLFHIMHLLGHLSIGATMVYLHVQDLEKLNLKSPIDLLEPLESVDKEPRKVPFAASA
jgi:integrase/recombinase XerD